MDRIYNINNTSIDLENIKCIISSFDKFGKHHLLIVECKANGQYVKDQYGEYELKNISDKIVIEFKDESKLKEAHDLLQTNWSDYLRTK